MQEQSEFNFSSLAALCLNFGEFALKKIEETSARRVALQVT